MKHLFITSFLIRDKPPKLNESYICLAKDNNKLHSTKLYIYDYEMHRKWFWQKKTPHFVNRFSQLDKIVIENIVAFTSLYDIHNYMTDSIEKKEK